MDEMILAKLFILLAPFIGVNGKGDLRVKRNWEQ